MEASLADRMGQRLHDLQVGIWLECREQFSYPAPITAGLRNSCELPGIMSELSSGYRLGGGPFRGYLPEWDRRPLDERARAPPYVLPRQQLARPTAMRHCSLG